MFSYLSSIGECVQFCVVSKLKLIMSCRCVSVCVCVMEDDLKQETLPRDEQAAGRVTVLLNTSILHPECVPSIVKLYCIYQHTNTQGTPTPHAKGEEITVRKGL